MNINRAMKIAATFGGSVQLTVRQYRQGLVVQYNHSTRHFTSEQRFWSYIYNLAGLPYHL